MKRKTYKGKRVSSSGPYSHVVDASDYLFFSGQTAYNNIHFKGKKYDIIKQTQMCFKNLKDVMEVAGVNLENVVKVNVYLTKMAYFEEMNNVYEEMFEEPYPARTCVAVYDLPLGADIEIECIVKRAY